MTLCVSVCGAACSAELAAAGFPFADLDVDFAAGFFAAAFFAAPAGEAASSERIAEVARKSRRFNRFSGRRWIHAVH